MPKRLIPLFPLQLVVFPRTRLPLHIFEERYKEMVGDAIRDDSEFGIVLAKEEGIVNAGCTVMVEKVLEMYPDGRMDILTRGQRRFEIVSLNEEKDYLQGEVEFFDDDDLAPVPAEVRELALSNYRALSRLGSARGHSDPDLEDRQVSFQVAQAVPDLDFLSLILRDRSENGRLAPVQRIPGRLSAAAARHRTHEGTGADERARPQAGGAVTHDAGLSWHTFPGASPSFAVSACVHGCVLAWVAFGGAGACAATGTIDLRPGDPPEREENRLVQFAGETAGDRRLDVPSPTRGRCGRG